MGRLLGLDLGVRGRGACRPDAQRAELRPAWPTRPIRMIVPTGAGTATDIMARLVANGIGARLGQPVVVENMPGASGLLGASGRGARDAGRLHVAVHRHVRDERQPDLVQDAAVRSGARLHRRRHGLQPRAADAVGQRRAAGEDGAGVLRLRQGQPRQAVDRVRQHRRRGPVRRQAAQPPRRPRPRRGALSLDRADDAGRGERRRPGADELDRGRARHGRGRQAAPAGRDLAGALSRRCPICRRSPSSRPASRSTAGSP